MRFNAFCGNFCVEGTGFGRIPSTRSTCESDGGEAVKSMYVRVCGLNCSVAGAETARYFLVASLILAGVLGRLSSDAEVVLGE